jgi:dihydroorotate dehydrogenase
VLKIAPDLDHSQLVDIAAAVEEAHVDGVIVSNTTVSRPSHLTHRSFGFFYPDVLQTKFSLSANKTETGGLSGPPLKPLSLATLRTLRTYLPASIPLIGCGGISTGRDVVDYGHAGAAFVQVYTAFGYDGPGTCRRIKDEIVDELRREKTTWKQIVAGAIENCAKKDITTGDAGLGQLLEDAKHLQKLVDEFIAKAN